MTTLMGGATNCQLSVTGVVTTIAGATSGYQDGTGTGALMTGPYGITTDGTNLYFIDSTNHSVRRQVIATGVVTTIGGQAPLTPAAGSTNAVGTASRFDFPLGTTTDGVNLFIADNNNHRIRQFVISTAAVTTLAGSTLGTTDATGVAAQFNLPAAVTTDGVNVFVADRANNRIRKIIISTGVVTTLAGNGVGSADGIGTAALFSGPYGITIDGQNLYVADSGNHRIRKIVIASATVTTLAGSVQGFADGIQTAAQFDTPYGIVTDGTNLYIGDTNNHKIRKVVIASGAVTTIAGSTGGNADGTGASAQFQNPAGLTTNGSALFLADINNNRLRRIN